MTTPPARRAVTTLGPPVDVEYAPRWTRDHHPWVIPAPGTIRYSPSEVREYDDLTKPMQWHKTGAAFGCGWRAEDDTNRYVIERIGHKSWTLKIFRLAITVGVRHIVGVTAREQTFTDTKGIAVDVAEAYRLLGEDYRPAEHGHRNRMTEAIGRAYADPTPVKTVTKRPQWRPEWTRSNPSSGVHLVEGHELRLTNRSWELRCPTSHDQLAPVETLTDAVEALADHLDACGDRGL